MTKHICFTPGIFCFCFWYLFIVVEAVVWVAQNHLTSFHFWKVQGEKKEENKTFYTWILPELQIMLVQSTQSFFSVKSVSLITTALWSRELHVWRTPKINSTDISARVKWNSECRQCTEKKEDEFKTDFCLDKTVSLHLFSYCASWISGSLPLVVVTAGHYRMSIFSVY